MTYDYEYFKKEVYILTKIDLNSYKEKEKVDKYVNNKAIIKKFYVEKSNKINTNKSTTNTKGQILIFFLPLLRTGI